MEIYLSSGAFCSRSLPDIVQFSLDNGLAHIELSSGVRYEPDMLAPVRASSGQPIRYLVHNYFPTPAEPFVLNLASADDQVLQRSCDLCKTAIALAAELGAPFYSVHSGFAVHLTPELLGDPVAQARLSKNAYMSYDAAYERFAETVKGLAEFAKSQGVRLLIENNVVSPLYLSKHGHNPFLMAIASEIVRLMEDINDATLGVLVDVGHANVSATALNFQREQFIETVAPYIGGFHLSDNDGQTDQNLPFDADAWFCPFLKDFPDTTLVIEAYRLSLEQMQQQYQVLETVLS
jgi:sugar phosphate isomerase/epimerase